MRKVLAIILVSLLLSATFVAGRFAVYSSVMPNANYGMRAIANRPKVSQLFIGSSMFRKGIFASDFGPDAFLLAYNGNQPAFESLQLQNLLEQGAQIHTLIVDLYPYSAVRQAAVSDMRMLTDGGPSLTTKIYHRINAADSQHSLSGLYRMFMQTGNEMLLTWPISYPLINNRYANGANATNVSGSTPEKLQHAESEEMQTMRTDLHKDQMKGLLQIMEMCQHHDINLLFLETPKYTRVYQDTVFCQIMQNYVSFLCEHNQRMILCESTCQQLDPALLSSPNIVRYAFDTSNAEYFSDLVHISSAGREAFTTQLKSILNSFDTSSL